MCHLLDMDGLSIFGVCRGVGEGLLVVDRVDPPRPEGQRELKVSGLKRFQPGSFQPGTAANETKMTC